MRRALIVMALAAVTALSLGWFLAARLPRWFDEAPSPDAPPAAAVPEAEGRKIRATLFYVAEDGTRLVAVPSEVPFAETTVDQARRLLEAQLGPAPEPYASAIPAGTTIRAVFTTDRNEAFVDLSPEATRAHPGGSLDEIFSVYTLVNVLTVNLPAISRVQILVDGLEVDSLAGHVDLRRPLPRNLTWVR